MEYKILGVYTGKIGLLSNNFESAIIKHSVPVLQIRKDHIDGDEVKNTLYHGGDMRVIHHYSLKNYRHLQFKFPDIKDRFVPGSFGENIVTEELSEDELFIGDIYQLGSAKVQLTVSRRPCVTLNYGYRDVRVLKEVIHTGKSGWFYRVLEEGEVKAGDTLKFIERPYPDLPVSRLFDQGYGTEKFNDFDFLKKCYDTGLMDKGWKPKIEAALKDK